MTGGLCRFRRGIGPGFGQPKETSIKKLAEKEDRPAGERTVRLMAAARQYFPLLRTVVLTSGARAYAALTTLVGLVLTVRWLGAEGRGIVVVVTTWVTLFANLGSLTLWQVSVHRSAQGQGKPWLGPFLGALAIVSTATTLIGWFVVAVLAAVAGDELLEGIPLPALALGFVALPFLMWEHFSNSLLSVVGRLGFHNLNQIVGRTFGILVLVVAVKFAGLGIYGFLLSFLAMEVLLSASGVVVLLRQASGRLRDGVKELRGLVRDGLKMHLQIAGALLYSSVDILLLHYFKGAAAAGVYQFASALFFALLLIPQSAVLALQARVARSPLEGFWSEHRAVLVLVTGGMTLIAAAVWLAAPWLTLTLATREFEAAGDALRIFMLAVPPASFVWMMTVQWLARGRFLSLGILYLSMGVVSCALNLLLIPRYGAQGAAAAAVIMWYSVPLVPCILMAMAAHREARGQARHRPPMAEKVPILADPPSLH